MRGAVAVAAALVAGFLLGNIPPAGPETLKCRDEDWVQIVGSGEIEMHVMVYCEPAATN